MHSSKTALLNSPHVYACCLWSWLGFPLTALWHAVYFRFCGLHNIFIPRNHWIRIKHDVMIRTSSPGGVINWTSRQLECLVKFIGKRHRGQSLLSMIDLSDWICLMSSNNAKYDKLNVSGTAQRRATPQRAVTQRNQWRKPGPQFGGTKKILPSPQIQKCGGTSPLIQKFG